MKKLLLRALFMTLSSLLAGCQFNFSSPQPPEHIVVVITVVVTATPLPTLDEDAESNIIATAALPSPTQAFSPSPAPSETPAPPPSPTPTREPSNTPSSRQRRLPTPVPDYSPGNGMAVLTGEPPYELSINPGGWQAYQIGPSANKWGYLVDINPHGPAPKDAFVESRILPEYFAGQWVDVLWVQAPGIWDTLPVTVDLIPTQGWKLAYESHTNLTPGEWTGWAMFDSSEGCGGVLDISPEDGNQSPYGVYIENTRVQPEGGGDWVLVARVQLSKQANKQSAWLRYYAPGLLGGEQLRKETTLSPGEWNKYVVGPSYIRQGYVVEVIPQTRADNEVAFSVVRPESTGEVWNDVLRVYVPEERPPLKALLRVLAVRVPGQ